MPPLSKASRSNVRVGELLEVVNALNENHAPVRGFNLVALQSSLRRLPSSEATEIESDARRRREEVVGFVRRQLGALRRSVRKFILTGIGTVTAENAMRVVDRYNQLIAARRFLRELPEMRKPAKDMSSSAFGTQFGFAKSAQLLELRIERRRSSSAPKGQSILHFEFSPIADILNGVDIDRIRICKNCDLLFWAGRYNAEYCSVRCGNAWRNRESRRQLRVAGMRNEVKEL